MDAENYTKTDRIRETIFMVLLYLLVLIFYAFDRRNPGITIQQLSFFTPYSIAALIISYLFLPRFFYRNKIIVFFISVAVILAVVICFEELILENIFFPGTKRAETFGGIVFTLVDILPVIGILSGAKFGWDAFRKQRKLDAMQLAVNESELQFLKSQLNPHFLFNNLNNLYSYALENNPKTPEIILELSGVLRYMLYETQEEYVSLSKDVEQLENFIRLNEMQIEDRGQVTFSKQGGFSLYEIAPLILVVFIENAFKHSTASQAGGIFIDVDINVKENAQLDFKCTNTFEEMSNNKSLSKGIGLQNVKKRLDLIYPNNHQLAIDQSDGKFSVHLTLNLHKKEVVN